MWPPEPNKGVAAIGRFGCLFPRYQTTAVQEMSLWQNPCRLGAGKLRSLLRRPPITPPPASGKQKWNRKDLQSTGSALLVTLMQTRCARFANQSLRSPPLSCMEGLGRRPTPAFACTALLPNRLCRGRDAI
jgi:hypothetical protein